MKDETVFVVWSWNVQHWPPYRKWTPLVGDFPAAPLSRQPLRSNNSNVSFFIHLNKYFLVCNEHHSLTRPLVWPANAWSCFLSQCISNHDKINNKVLVPWWFFKAHKLYYTSIPTVLRWQMFSQKINSLPSQVVMENAGVFKSTCTCKKKCPSLMFSAYSDTMK